MKPAYARSDTTTLGEFFEGLSIFPIGFIVASTTAPGFIMCIPGLTLIALVVVLPLVAVALVLAVLVLAVAMPIVLFRLGRMGVTRLAAAWPRRAPAHERAPELETLVPREA